MHPILGLLYSKSSLPRKCSLYSTKHVFIDENYFIYIPAFDISGFDPLFHLYRME